MRNVIPINIEVFHINVSIRVFKDHLPLFSKGSFIKLGHSVDQRNPISTSIKMVIAWNT
jgi:hypothetical protein